MRNKLNPSFLLMHKFAGLLLYVEFYIGWALSTCWTSSKLKSFFAGCHLIDLITLMRVFAEQDATNVLLIMPLSRSPSPRKAMHML